jgi:hypothetical protein
LIVHPVYCYPIFKNYLKKIQTLKRKKTTKKYVDVFAIKTKEFHEQKKKKAFLTKKQTKAKKHINIKKKTRT